MQEGFDKFLEHMTWKNSFSLSREIVEDSKLMDLKKQPAAFVAGYYRTRERFGAALFGAAITKAHLPPRILEAAHGAQPGEEGGGLGEGFDAGAREGAPGDAPARNEVFASGSVDTVYYELIRSTLDACNGNLSKAAEQLGVARSTLYRRLRKFGIIE